MDSINNVSDIHKDCGVQRTCERRPTAHKGDLRNLNDHVPGELHNLLHGKTTNGAPDDTEFETSDSTEDHRFTNDNHDHLLQDRGWAWMVVLGCFLSHLITGGLERSDGVFFLKLTSRYDESAQVTSWAGALSGTVMLSMGPVAGAVCNRYSARASVMAGGVLYTLGLVLSGLAPSMPVLLVCFGVIQGIGRGLAYAPGLIMVGMYFNRRRGLGVGLSTAGVGAGTFLLPPLVEFLFETFGFSGAFLILGGLAGNIFLVAMLYRPQFVHRRIVLGSRCRQPFLSRQKRPDEEMTTGTEPESPVQKYLLDKNSAYVHNGNTCDMATFTTHSTESSNSSSSVLPKSNALDVCCEISTDDNARTSATSGPWPEVRDIQMWDGCAATDHRGHCQQTSTCDTAMAARQFHDTPDSDGEGDQSFRRTTDENNMCSSKRTLGSGATNNHSETPALEENPTEYPKSLEPFTPDLQFKVTAAVSRERLPLGWFKSFLYTCFPSDRRGRGQKKRKLIEWNLLREPVFLFYCLSICLYTASLKSSLVFLPPLAKSRGVSEIHAAYLLSVSGVLDTIGRVTAGVVLELRPLQKFRPFFFNSFIFALCTLYFVAPALSSFAEFVVIFGLFGMLTGAYVCQKSVILVDMLGQAQLGSSFGLLSFFQGLGNCVGPPLSGLLRDVFGQFDEAFYLGGGMLAMSGCLMIISNIFHARLVRKQRGVRDG